MSTKPEIEQFKRLRARCAMPALFAGWSPEDAFRAIEEVFRQDSGWLYSEVLRPDFRVQVASVRKRHWSYGYCFEIVEITKLIFVAAGLKYEPRVKVTKKQARGRLRKHHVLKMDNFCFDPAKGAREPWSEYKDYAKGHQMPQCPGARTVKLFLRLLIHCKSSGRFNQHQLSELSRFEEELPSFQHLLIVARNKGRACMDIGKI